MRRYYLLLSFFSITFVSTNGQVPQTLSYQGLLTDASGNPLSGTHTALFNFYTVATGGTVAFARGPLSVTTFQGLFTVILGNGQGSNNTGLPSLGSAQYYIGIVADGGTELSPRVALTAVPYAFTASALDANATINSSQLTGSITTATLPATNITGSISNTQLATGIDATKVNLNSLAIANGGTGAATAAGASTNLGLAIGTNVEAWNSNLDDLADGSLTGSKVGSGIIPSNLTGAGTIPLSAIPSDGGVPVGTVIAFAGQSLPPNWLFCDGTAISSTTYLKLFNAIGTTWGGNSTNFNLPDLRGIFLRGWSSNANATVDPDVANRTGGNTVGSTQEDAFQGHLPGGGISGVQVTSGSSYNVAATNYTTSSQSLSGHVGGLILVSDGSNGNPRIGQETRPKNAYVMYIIKYQ